MAQSNKNKIATIRSTLSTKALLLQLSEECGELVAAISKYLRKKDTNNPTPKTIEEIVDNLFEEIADVKVALDVLDVSDDDNLYNAKLDRWYKRLKK